MKKTGEISSIAVIGSGKMGMEIFNHLWPLGFRIVVLCADHPECNRASLQFAKKVGRQEEAGILSRGAAMELRQKVRFVTEPDALREAHLVIECIPEDLQLKKDLFAQIIPCLDPYCILSSNSSSITPSMLVPDGYPLTRFIGLHFFYPVRLKNIVEIIIPKGTHPEVLRSVAEFIRKTGKTSLLLREQDAFILNKLFLEVQIVAFEILREGKLGMQQIDGLVSEHLFPGGVFEFFDQVGIPVIAGAIQNYTMHLPDRCRYEPLLEVFAGMIEKGKYGLRTRSGFYDYSVPQPSGMIAPADEAAAAEAVERMRKVYFGKAHEIVSCGICTRSELEYAVREYMNTDTGPFALEEKLMN